MGEAAVNYTFEFVRRHLPKGATRVLEIGCGNGELAAMLQENGLDVVALDSDRECVASARETGVDARLATWPCAVEGTFGAVLFTRSLHHIQPLEEGIDAAVAALRPGGTIIIEDFRIEADSDRTNAWYAELVRSLDADKQFVDETSTERLFEKLDFGEHRDELHSSIAMAETLSRHGDVLRQDAAYYFRYLEKELRAPGSAQSILDEELALIRSGDIDALGKRFVLTPGG